jgi:hypothetical protein
MIKLYTTGFTEQTAEDFFCIVTRRKSEENS